MLTRRELLLAAAAAPAVPLLGCKKAAAPQQPAGDVMEAVLEQLLPDGVVAGVPGAREARVADHVRRELAQPHFQHFARAVQRGLGELDALSLREAGRPFAALPAPQQRALLGRFQADPFFEVLRTLALEGYLGSPAPGGNPQAVVWKAFGIGA